MTNLRRLLSLAALFALLAGGAFAQNIDTTGFLDRIDENTTLSDTDFSSEMTLVIEDPEEGIDRQRVRMFRRDRDEAFVLLILEPEVNRGQGYLQVDDALWFYDPDSRSFSFTSQSESFQGSDARNSDFASSSLEDDYDIVAVEEGRLGNFEVYILDLEATNNEVTYPTQRLWVTRNELLVLKTEDYSVAGRLLRTTFIPRYISIEDAFLPTQMILVDELVADKKTTITFEDISTADLPDSVFTRSYVERVSL